MTPPPIQGRPRTPKMEEQAMTKDPVCGMNVDEKTAAAREDYRGVTYYFCSPACRTAFQSKPEQYAEQTQGG